MRNENAVSARFRKQAELFSQRIAVGYEVPSG